MLYAILQGFFEKLVVFSPNTPSITQYKNEEKKLFLQHYPWITTGMSQKKSTKIQVKP